MSYRIITTTKGKSAVFFENFYYNFQRHNKKENSDYFRCRSQKCSASITICCSTKDLLRSKGNHSHSSQQDVTIEISSAMSLMRIRAKDEPTVSIGTIYEESLLELRKKHDDIELAEYLPEFESLKASLYRQRAKVFPPLPKSLDDLKTLPERFIITNRGEQFVISRPEHYNKVKLSLAINVFLMF